MGRAALGAELGPTRSAAPAGASASTWATPTSCCSGGPAADDTVRGVGPRLRAVGARAGPTWSSCGPGPDAGELTLRVWERGVGETLACGTGSVRRRRRRPRPGCGRRPRPGAQPGRRPRGRARRRRGLPGRPDPEGGRRHRRRGGARRPSARRCVRSGRARTLRRPRWRLDRDAHRAQLPRADRARRCGVPVDVGRRRSTPTSTSWPCSSTRPVPTWWAGWCSAATGPTPPPSSGGARPQELARAVADRRRRHRGLRRRALARPSSATWRRSSAGPPSTARR